MPKPSIGGRRRRQMRNKDSAMAIHNLPQDVIVEILSRLPVKSVLRFSSVCKSWLALFANPTFIARHLNRISQNPNYASLVVESRSKSSAKHMTNTIFRIDSVDSPIHDDPYPKTFPKMDLVGSINGIICFTSAPLRDIIILWNPATRMRKVIRYPDPVIHTNEYINQFSVGFGFDPVENDFRIIRMECLEAPMMDYTPVKVEVFSINKDAWKVVEVPFQFTPASKCSAIVNGMPYFPVMVHDESGFRQELLGFDVNNEVHRVPMMEYCKAEMISFCIANFKESLSTIVYRRNKTLEIFTADGKCGIWVKQYTVGPLVNVKRVIQCFKYGELVADDAKGKLYLCDPKTSEIKNLRIDDEPKVFSMDGFSHTESLVSIKGMEKVKWEKDKNGKRCSRKNRIAMQTCFPSLQGHSEKRAQQSPTKNVGLQSRNCAESFSIKGIQQTGVIRNYDRKKNELRGDC